MVINLKNIDLRKPENKFSKEVLLPHGRGKDVKVSVISDKISNAIKKSDIEKLNKKEIRSFIRENDFFLCDVSLMSFVGKKLGKFLGPLGKMPSPIPPNIPNVEALINAKKKTVRVRVTNSPVIHTLVGSEKMEEEQIKENVMKVFSVVRDALQKGEAQIKDVRIKLTMSPSVRVDVNA